MKTTIAAFALPTLRAAHASARAHTAAVLAKHFGNVPEFAQKASENPELWGKLGEAVKAELAAQALYCAAVNAARLA